MKPRMKHAKKLSTLAVVFATSLTLAACSSSDDDDDAGDGDGDTTMMTDGDVDDDDNGDAETEGEGDTSMANPNLMTVSFPLSSAITVPPATGADNASGEASFAVDTETGTIAGNATVRDTSGPATVAHIHAGEAGVAGPVVVTLESNDDGTIWSVPEGSILDADSIAAFQAGNLYVNVHTELNAPGELRGQLVEAGPAAPSAGSVTFMFTNTSGAQPMTPPVVALHNAPGSENGIRLFEVGQPAIGEIVQIAENGNNDPLVAVAQGQIGAGTVSAAGVAFPDPENPGPLTPGATASLTLDVESPDQVMTIVSMVVCTNDGFSGIDSQPIPEASETITMPIYDAGSETNVLTLNYWVPPCSGDAGSENLTDNEGGAIQLHPGQEGSENPAFDFPAGSELLEVTITRN